MSKITHLAVSFCLVLISTSALAQSGVVDSTKNPNQLAVRHWYQANQSAQQSGLPTAPSFPTGKGPIALAFDGANMWTVNFSDNTVTKLRAKDGSLLGTFAVGTNPWAAAFDGANIWVTNRGDSTVSKLRASDGALLGTFPVGVEPYALAFDGNSMWVTNFGDSTVTILQASNGIELGVVGAPGCCPNPVGVAFDGTNIWVTSAQDSPASVTKLRASDGAVLGTFAAGLLPRAVA